MTRREINATKRVKIAEVRQMAKTVAARMPTEDLMEATKILEAEIHAAIENAEHDDLVSTMYHAGAYIGERLVQRWNLKWQQKDLCLKFPSLKWSEEADSMNIMPMLWIMYFLRHGRSIALSVEGVPRFLATDGEYQIPSEAIPMFQYLAAHYNDMLKFSKQEGDIEEKILTHIVLTYNEWEPPYDLNSAIKGYGAYLGSVYEQKYEGSWHYDTENETYGILTKDGTFINPFKKVEAFIEKVRLQGLINS
jgi:hypothetical protein